MKSLSNVKKMPSNNLKNQRGLTLVSWIFVVAILVFCGLFAFRVVPMYAENMYVVKALKSIAEPGMQVNDMSDAEIKKKIQNFYLVNNVRSDGPQNIVIDRKSRNLLIKIDYENRTNLFYNIDVVASFQNHLDGDHLAACCKPMADQRAKR